MIMASFCCVERPGRGSAWLYLQLPSDHEGPLFSLCGILRPEDHSKARPFPETLTIQVDRKCLRKLMETHPIPMIARLELCGFPGFWGRGKIVKHSF